MKIEELRAESRISLVQAAEILDSTPLNVLMHVKRGLLLAEENEASWLIDPASLASLLSRRQLGAMPAVCKSGCGRKTGTCGHCG